MTDNETMEKIRAELRKAKARCSMYCGTWNSEDHDCEIYGSQHPSPSNCIYFLNAEIERRGKKNER